MFSHASVYRSTPRSANHYLSLHIHDFFPVFVAEALANRSHGGRVIEPARYEYPTSTTILPTNAGYDQPPPAYDVIAADSARVPQPPDAALPSYYDLYKEEDVKQDEAGIPGNSSEETNSPGAQESSTATNRNESQNTQNSQNS